MLDAILLETITLCDANNLRKFKRSNAISAYVLLGTDMLVPDEMIRVPRMIGARTALISHDLSLGGIYNTIIYQ